MNPFTALKNLSPFHFTFLFFFFHSSYQPFTPLHFAIHLYNSLPFTSLPFTFYFLSHSLPPLFYTSLTFVLKIWILPREVPITPSGSWFQSVMDLFTKEYFLTDFTSLSPIHMTCTSGCDYSFMYSWWWVKRTPETCRVTLQNNKNDCLKLHLFGYSSKIPWTRFPACLYTVVKYTWTKLHGQGGTNMSFFWTLLSGCWLCFTASGTHFQPINTDN